MEMINNLKSEALLELIFFAGSKGNEDEVINSVLPVYLRKLNCFMAGIIKTEKSGLLDKLILPFAFKNNEVLEYLREYIQSSDKNNERGCCEIIRGDNYFYIYCLADYGYLILGRKNPFSLLFKNEFRNIVDFLGKVITQAVDDELRRAAENKLTEERRLLRTIIDNIPVSIYAKDLEYKKTLANKSELKHLGLESEVEVLGKTDYDIYEESIANNTLIEDQQVICEGQSILGEVKPMGDDNWALISKLPLRNENEQIVGLVGISIDYTERKKTQEQLTIFLNLFNNISDAVQVITEEGQLFYLNKVAGEVLGIDPAHVGEFYVTDYLNHFPTMEDWNKHVAQLKAEDHLTIERLYMNIITKTEIPVEVTVKYIFLNGKGFIVANSRDITERKRNENELRASEERKASLISSISDLVFVLDNDLRFVEYHIPAGTSVFFNLEKYLGKKVPDMDISQPSKAKIEVVLSYCIQNKSFSKAEIYFDTPNGRLWYDLHATILKGQDGLTDGVTCVARDITYRKQREEVIRQQLKLQDILIKISSTYINIELDKVEATIQNSLQELAEFVGADRAYIFDYDFNNETTSNTYEWCADGIVPEIEQLQNVSLDRLTNFLRKHLKGEEFYVSDVRKLENNCSGLKETLEAQSLKSVISIPMKNGDELLGFIGFDSIKQAHSYTDKEKTLLEVFSQMLVNVIERKRHDGLLVRQEEKYRNIITNMNLGIIEVDEEENILYANQSFCDISGYNQDEIKKIKATSFLHSSDNELELPEKTKLRGNGVSTGYELAVKNKQGEPRWWFVSDAPNYNDKNEHIGSIGIHLDITDQKKLEKELEKAIIVAEEASKAKEVFLANMSHEIRTPLNVITGMIRELGKDNLTDMQRKYVSHSETATYHLLAIVNNILDMSKIEAGEFTLENKDFSISSVASDVMSILYSKAQEKGLELRIIESPSIKKSLIGDAGRLRQIFINLMGNSLKFTERGFVELKISVVDTTNDNQRLLFEVSDSGIGMSEPFMKKLFDKFSQEEGAANRRFEGSGLGMSITKELVQLMGADIVAKSKKGVGTQISFEVDFPIGSQNSLVAKTDKASKNCFEGTRVLLVEDNEMNRFIAIQSLNFVGCVVTEAENGLVAIDKLKTADFDVVLMDIQMPVMDGVEATKLIRSELSKEIPIIALTANAFKHDIDLYLSVGMNDYLIKPYREDDLYSKIGMFKNYNMDVKNIEVSSEVILLYSLAQLEEIGKDDESFIDNMLRMFINVAGQGIIQFKEHLANNDIESIRKLAHKIKPNVQILEIKAISDKILLLEKFGLEESPKLDLNALVEEVTGVLQSVIDDINKKLNQ
jgi:PAS domain S-box-containing protein